MHHRKIILKVMICFLILGSSLPVFGETFEDAMGREITLHKAPARIIPLAPSLTEIVYFLGLGDRVVGVTEFSYYPPEAMAKPKVGSYINLNIERIISLSPELAIGTKDGNQPGIIELLEQAGIQIFIVNPRKVKDVIKTISQIGDVCGVSEKAGLLTRQLNQRMERIQSVIATKERPLVFFQINLRPIMTVNRDTFHHDLITLAGGLNLAQDEPITYPRISREEVIRRRPDVIIISSMDRGGGFEDARQEWLEWPSIPAVKHNRVHLINSDLTDRPSPRIIDGLEAMVRMIHP
ncbi:MAG: cobalamin-binding protein [Deltaproteobacteria bacterium]|nr:cobalamin-binding protein [Deltaproteobacteria bacterium]